MDATEVAGVDVYAEDVVTALDDEELFARRLAASFARSLRSTATAGDLEPEGPAAEDDATLEEGDLGALFAPAMNF